MKNYFSEENATKAKEIVEVLRMWSITKSDAIVILSRALLQIKETKREEFEKNPLDGTKFKAEIAKPITCHCGSTYPDPHKPFCSLSYNGNA
jgi:hypothetical protein